MRSHDLKTFIFAFIAVLFIHPVSFSTTRTSCNIEMDESRDLLSANIDHVDISEVAAKLSLKTGLTVYLDSSLRHPVSIRFNYIPLELGIKRILGSLSSAFIYAREISDGGKSEIVLKSIKIFHSGNPMAGDYTTYAKGQELISGTGNTEPSDPDIPDHRLPASSHGVNAGGKIHYHIMLAKQNLGYIRQRSRSQQQRIHEKIADLRSQIYQSPSPEKRVALFKELKEAETELTQVQSTNEVVISDEEKNIQLMMKEATVMEEKQEFIRRQVNLRE